LLGRGGHRGRDGETKKDQLVLGGTKIGEKSTLGYHKIGIYCQERQIPRKKGSRGKLLRMEEKD